MASLSTLEVAVNKSRLGYNWFACLLCLVDDEENKLIRPLAFHDRFQQLLPEAASKVQKQLEKLENHAIVNEMKINKKKTIAMLFNTATKKDFFPNLKLDNDTVELVEEMKLLGVHITSDMKWNKNTEVIT